jgi:hypothetical protein
MKCDCCGKKVEELSSLTVYTKNVYGVDDLGEYCDTCFNDKYGYIFTQSTTTLTQPDGE